MSKHTNSKVTKFLNCNEYGRRRNLTRMTTPWCRRPQTVPKEILALIQELLPAVIRRTKSAWVQDAKNEIRNEFFLLVASVGRTLQQPGFTDRQYLTLLLYKSANRVKAKNKSRQSVELEPAMGSAKPSPSVRHEAEMLQTVEEVRRVLATLSDSVQQTAARRWYDGIPVKKIAADEGVSINTINMRLHRARTSLRQLNVPMRLRGPRRKKR